MISHSNGDAAYHREQRGIKTPEQKRIERLEADAKANEEQFWNLSKEIIALKAELAECKRDAERWREYQARKVRLTEAGFGKSPLRDSAIAAQKGEGK